MPDVGGLGSILGALGGVGALVTAVKVIPELRTLRANTRKIEAETTGEAQDAVAVLSATALAQMNAAVERANGAEKRLRDLEDQFRVHRTDCTERQDMLERTLEAYRVAAQDHVLWDVQRIQDAQRYGLPEPPHAPPLLPARGVDLTRRGPDA